MTYMELLGTSGHTAAGLNAIEELLLVCTEGMPK